MPLDDEDVRKAEVRGREAARVEAHLGEHERRLAAINGSIARFAGEVSAVGHQVAGIITELAKNAALAEQRDRQIRETNETQVSTRTFLIGVATLIIALIALFLGTGHL